MKTWTRRTVVALAVISAIAAAGACTNKAEQQASQKGTTSLGASADLKTLMAARGLSEADVEAALKTYTPTGKKDEYLLFASGGHSGQVFVIGVPSMRQLKTIAVFTPEPWQGYGYGDESNKILAGASVGTHALSWGDVHHPALSETKGDYDGQFLFVNDKANGRIAVIDLKDFMTKQIVVDPLVGRHSRGSLEAREEG
jgi:nitrous-oxide reductase